MAVMTSMRTKMHVVLWAVLVLFILSMTIGGFVGGADIIDQLLGKTNPAEAIGVINGENIPPEYFNQLVSQQLDQYRANGQQINDQLLDRTRSQVWDNLIRETLIANKIKELGIKVTDEEVVFHLQNNPPQFIRTLPDFQTDGQFDIQKYQQAINNPEGNEWAPVEQIMRTSVIPNYKLQKMLNSTISVSEDEVRNEYIRQNIQYTVDAVHITDKDVDQSILEISDSEIKRAYKSRKDEFEQPETRKLRFVYWKKEATNLDTTSVYNTALDIIDQVNSGENFAELANIYSEDPGNQITPDSARGGDLGWFERGQMVKPFSDAAFRARKGQVVGPVLSQFGYHVIKVSGKRNLGGKEQVQAAHILLKIGVGAETRDALRRDATLFSYDAQDYGFDAALDTHTVVASETSIKQEDIIISPVGQFRNAVKFAYTDNVGTVSAPMDNDDYFAVFLIDSAIPAGPTPLDDVRDQIIADLKKDKATLATNDAAIDLRNQINRGLTFDEIVEQNGNYNIITDASGTMISGFNSIGRSNFVSGALLNAKSSDVLGPLKTANGYAIVFVKDVGDLDAAVYDLQKINVKNTLLTNKQNQVYQNWIKNLEDKAEIEDFRKFHF